jgi:hypothetical protein
VSHGLHDPVEHSPQSSRVIRMGHKHDALELLLVAPWRQRLNFLFGSIDRGDSHDVRHAERIQVANLPRRITVVREPPAGELIVLFARRIHENGGSLRDAALHEVRRFERTGAT